METKELFKKKENESRKRPLIAYAFLAQATNRNGDLISGLTPIFKPIAALYSNQKFSANDFASKLKEFYGIEIHPWAVDDIVPRLESAGLIRKINITEKSYEYYYNDIPNDFNEVTEADIRFVLKEFINFSRPLLIAHDLEISDTEIEDEFLSELIKMDFHSIQIKPDRSKEEGKKATTLGLKKSPEKKEWEDKVNANAKIDVLCSAFIVDLFHKNKQLYELIVKIASGALISEVVLNFQAPSTGVSLNNLNVVLDAPLVMSILDLTSEQENKYAVNLLAQLAENKAQIFIFQHSVEEIHSNLKSVLKRFDNGTATGATARRSASPVFKAYAYSVFADIENVLTQKNIRIIKAPSSSTSYQYLSDEDQEAFKKSLGIYQNQFAQERDAASVAAVVRLRQGRAVRVSNFQNSHYIFITTNPWIPEKVLRFLVKRKIQADNDTPPVISDRYLAGMLWVMFGGKSEEFTRYRLLANCTAALEPRDDVVQKTNKFLKELDPDKADHFLALMTTQRAGQHLMQMTLGESLYVSSTQDAEQILEALKQTLTEEQNIKHENELKVIQTSHQQEIQEKLDATDKLMNTVSDQVAKIANIEDQLNTTARDRQTLIDTLKQEKLNSLEDKALQVRKYVNSANKFRNRFISAIELIFTLIIFGCGLLATEAVSKNHPAFPYIGAFIVAVIFYFTALRSPDKYIYKQADAMRDKKFLNEIQQHGLLKDLELFNLDLEKGIVNIKPDEYSKVDKIGVNL